MTFCVFVDIYFYKAAGPGPWWLGFRALTASTYTSLCLELKSCFKLLQAKAT